MKKIMCLGGNYFQMTATKAAKKLGYHVISVDYMPNNPAHKYADEYFNISTIDKDAVLDLAKEKHIDGIMSYASDVSAPTAAYVAEYLNLPTNPYESVYLMTRKELFHPFLKKNGFFIPEMSVINDKEDLYEFFNRIRGDIIVKPVNSCGSKGISRVTTTNEIDKAYQVADLYSKGAGIIAEEFIQRKNYQIAGDAFIVDGKIAFFGIANEHFDRLANPLVPIGESFPADLSDASKIYARKEIQRAVDLLGLKNGAINLDFMFDTEGRLFIIELGPRNGGNLITDAIKLSSGVDLAEYTVKAALGEDISDLKDKNMKRYISSYIFHSSRNGTYNGINISDELKDKIVISDMFVKSGDYIERYENASYGLGAALLQFDNKDEMLYMMEHMEEYCDINVS